MTTIEDARVKKTKAKLLASFQLLLAEKTFEDITINEICETSGIRRATFYKHFTDKYDFLKYFVGSLRWRFDAKIERKTRTDSDPYYVEYLGAIVDFLTGNEGIVKNCLESNALPIIVEVIKEKNFEDTCERLRESERAGLTLPASTEIVATMMIGAVAEAILRWFKGGKKMPKEALIKETSAVIVKMGNLE